MIQINKKEYYFLVLSLIICFFDQITKYYINLNIKSLLNKNFILFSLENVKNYGAAFNILSGNRLLLASISIIFSLALIYYISKKNNTRTIELYSYSFILGGTLGNGIDRIIKGYVTDFISLNFINFPVFNIADISINVGFLFFIYSLIKNKKDEEIL